ncbi:MAG: L-threonylcarbamoyladenylate synthase [Candidatus Thorarchaeota archaeon]
MTKILSNKNQLSVNELNLITRLIKTGEVIVFPTETVYGLGANAFDFKAVDKIFKIKGRPSDNPLIVHIGDTKLLHEITNSEKIKEKNLEKTIYKLRNLFWPGPLTLVLPKSEKIPYNVTAGLDTVAVRMPSHPIALQMLTNCKLPIAAPSANISGSPSPTTVEDAIEDLYGKIPLIIDGGKCKIGLESTVLDISDYPPTILRPGGVTFEELQKIFNELTVKEGQEVQIRSPGMKYSHYQPKAKVFVYIGEKEKIYLKFREMIKKYHEKSLKVGLLISEEIIDANADYVCKYGEKSAENLKYLASIMFHEFREMDRKNINIILVQGVSNRGIGLAIMNRLRKSAGNQIIKL